MAEENQEQQVQSTENLRNTIMSGGRDLLQGASGFFSKLHQFEIGENLVEYDKIADINKRFMFGLVMGNQVLKIGEDFVRDARHVRKIQFSNALQEIPANACNGCGKLSVVNFNNLTNLKYIRDNAFAGTNIREIPKLANLQVIGAGSFSDCTKLRHVNFDKNSDIRVIDEFAFDGCKRLVDQKHAMLGGWGGKFELPQKLERLGQGAFGGCHKIRKLEIPQSVSEISGNPFKSPNDVKENGKMKLRARWRNWHSKIYIEGIDKAIRAKNFQGMETSLDGLRHIMINGQHMVEQEKGKYKVLNKKEYEEWKSQKDDELVNGVQVSREAFVAYCASKGLNIDINNVGVNVVDQFNKSKEDSIILNVNGKKALNIPVLDIKKFSCQFNREQQIEVAEAQQVLTPEQPQFEVGEMQQSSVPEQQSEVNENQQVPAPEQQTGIREIDEMVNNGLVTKILPDGNYIINELNSAETSVVKSTNDSALTGKPKGQEMMQ